MIQILVLTLTISLATASLQEDHQFIQCAKQRVNALKGLSDEQLIERTQQNLVDASQLVAKRASAAKAQGLVCYDTFNNDYGKSVMAIMGPTGEQQVLSNARNQREKSSATKQIATMTEYIMCDEAYRANHINDAVECNIFEKNGLALTEFTVSLPIIETVMGAGGVLMKGCSPPMASVITQMKNLYGKLYSAGKQCSQSQDLPVDQQCRNLKMFNLELRRLGQLGALVAASKIPTPF
ncbi:uncharacterized protein LOC128954053 [Oppia nitens]|uniref:uncharacterized protein LOC128954053 n=1 Tax=Oppia nitens TaxID=1686743 RepID=UPI0023DA1AE1|nr:uncharacterized protein LOC128954053 [Oppia nitens]